MAIIKVYFHLDNVISILKLILTQENEFSQHIYIDFIRFNFIYTISSLTEYVSH